MELRWDVGFDDLHLFQFFEPSLRGLLLIMPSEMFNVLRVVQFLFGAVVIMELLEVMNLVLVLDVAMVSRAEAEIWQPSASLEGLRPVVACDRALVSLIEKIEHGLNGGCLPRLVHAIITFVIEAVCLADFVGGPRPG